MYKKKLITLLSGASLTLGFAPFHLWVFSYLSLILLIWLIDITYKEELVRQNKHNNIFTHYSNYFDIAFIWGIGFFGTNVSWIFVSIYKYGGTTVFISGLITLFFILYLSIFPVINLIILKKFNLINPKDWIFLIAFPTSWVLIEFFRGWFLTGFPWGLLGYTQLNNFIRYYASSFGVYGVSFIVIFISCLLYWSAYQKPITKILSASFIFMVFIFGFYLKNVSTNSIPKFNLQQPIDTHKVAIIQINTKPNDKFLFQSIDHSLESIKKIYWYSTTGLFSKNLNLFKFYKVKQNKILDTEGIESIIEGIELVIWPENSLPLDLDYPAVKNFLQEIDLFAKKHNFGLLIGAPIEAITESTNNGDYYIYTRHKQLYKQFYNSTLAFGIANGVYHKINLVPFGDYVPLEKWLRGLINFFNLPLSSFVAGKIKQPGISFKNNKILATVCYDIAYSSLLRKRVLDLKPSVIVAISEDGWFGDSLGPHQHLDIARMRAIENGKFVLRATTSGISAIIDQHGDIINQSSMFEKTILISEYKDYFNQTIWNKIGNLPLIMLLLISFIVVALVSRRR